MSCFFFFIDARIHGYIHSVRLRTDCRCRPEFNASTRNAKRRVPVIEFYLFIYFSIHCAFDYLYYERSTGMAGVEGTRSFRFYLFFFLF